MEMRQQDAREVIKRKVPMGRTIHRDEEDDEEEETKIEVGQRRIVQPRRRLGERLGLAGRGKLFYSERVFTNSFLYLGLEIAWEPGWTRDETCEK